MSNQLKSTKEYLENMSNSEFSLMSKKVREEMIKNIKSISVGDDQHAIDFVKNIEVTKHMVVEMLGRELC